MTIYQGPPSADNAFSPSISLFSRSAKRGFLLFCAPYQGRRLLFPRICACSSLARRYQDNHAVCNAFPPSTLSSRTYLHCACATCEILAPCELALSDESWPKAPDTCRMRATSNTLYLWRSLSPIHASGRQPHAPSIRPIVYPVTSIPKQVPEHQTPQSWPTKSYPVTCIIVKAASSKSRVPVVLCGP